MFLLSFNCYSQLVNDSTINKLNQRLEETGISQVIKYRNFVEQNGIYRIQFDFCSNDAAKNNQLWQMLKKNFKKDVKNKQKSSKKKKKLKGIDNTDIKQYLYFYCINIFQLKDPKNVLLEIRQSYINQNCPFIQFYYNEDTHKFTGEEKEKICMAEYSDNVSINALDFFEKKTITKNPEKTIAQYYEILNNHFRGIYAKGGFEKNSKETKFKSFYRRGDDVLKFDVIDLEKEVLKDAGENFVYSILSLFSDETYIPYEHIKIEIRLILNKNTNQMEIKIKVVGRYGSGFYRNKNWYTMNDLDTGFPAYINDYTKEITNEIVRKITKYHQYGK